MNEVARSYTHNLGVISLVVLTFILDIVIVGFCRYHIISLLQPLKSWKHMNVSIYPIS